MMDKLLSGGIEEDRISLEEESRNTRDNIMNSLRIFFELKSHPKSLLVLCAGLQSRRVDLYLKKGLVHFFEGHDITYFIADADVQILTKRNNQGEIDNEYIEDRVNYEWRRLRRYRHQGDL